MSREAKVPFGILLVVGLLRAVPQPQTGLPPGKIQDVERAISAEMARENIPGMSVAVAIESRLRWSNGFGLADMENFVPAKVTTVYRLASVSKPVTAVAVMQLAEKGKLDLDAPIQKYVPYFPRKRWPVTARHLLAHQGGIRHYLYEYEAYNTRHYTSVRQTVLIFQKNPLLFEPGTQYHYTTYGYNLLGAAVEGASGMEFVDYLRQNIFEPARMPRTRADSVYDIIPNRARGYRKTLKYGLQNCAFTDTSNKIPGGGLCGTAEDLMEFAIHLTGGTLLNRDTVEQMFTKQRTKDGKLTSYGLGWRIGERGDRRWVSHDGGQQGFSTLLWMLPKEGLIVVLMANLEGVNLYRLTGQIAGIVLR